MYISLSRFTMAGYMDQRQEDFFWELNREEPVPWPLPTGVDATLQLCFGSDLNVLLPLIEQHALALQEKLRPKFKHPETYGVLSKYILALSAVHGVPPLEATKDHLTRWLQPRLDHAIDGETVPRIFLESKDRIPHWVSVATVHCPNLGKTDIKWGNENILATWDGFQNIGGVGGYCVQILNSGLVRVLTELF